MADGELRAGCGIAAGEAHRTEFWVDIHRTGKTGGGGGGICTYFR